MGFSIINIPLYMLLLLVVVSTSYGDKVQSVDQPRLTHADAAVIFAKHLGLFDRYVSRDASLDECAAFLNKTGIYFGLLETVNGTDFALKDCARVMGQVELVLSGEAEYSFGKVKLPKNIESWEEFCMLNGLEYRQAYQELLKAVGLIRVNTGRF